MGETLWAIARLWMAIGRVLESIIRMIFCPGHATLTPVGTATFHIPDDTPTPDLLAPGLRVVVDMTADYDRPGIYYLRHGDDLVVYRVERQADGFALSDDKTVTTILPPATFAASVQGRVIYTVTPC